MRSVAEGEARAVAFWKGQAKGMKQQGHFELGLGADQEN